jgi:hypothetical protein
MTEGMIIVGGMISPDARRDVFISYRRDGSADFARILDEHLEKALYNVFFDVEDLSSGKFDRKLLYFIENCLDFLLVLPKNGLDRCKDPNDWLRIEIECAIENKKNVIPIMLKGFQWPDPAELPESLRELQNYNALQPSQEYFEASIFKLTRMMLSKPLFVNAEIKPPHPAGKPRRVLLERALIALVAIAMGVGGTLVTQRLLHREPSDDGNSTPTAVAAAQTPQATATEAPAYAQGFINGSAIDRAVREILGVPSGDLLLEDVEGITEINLSGLALTDIGELAELTGLKTLDLHNNKISDLSPLAELYELESLLIYNNRVASIQPLSGLTNLTDLSAENNQIADVSPLAGLTALKKLYLQDNQIADVSPIRNLVDLTRLVLDGNPVADYTPLRSFDTTVFQIPQE